MGERQDDHMPENDQRCELLDDHERLNARRALSHVGSAVQILKAGRLQYNDIDQGAGIVISTPSIRRSGAAQTTETLSGNHLRPDDPWL
nr:hypothetical protein CFP56_03311 [Quercus suber]